MPIPSSAKAIPRSLTRDKVYRTIKTWIINLQMEPGELIRDKELAERLGVSRMPVREALRRLEDEGLVVTKFHKWTKVADLEFEQSEHLYPIIASLQATAMELAFPNLSTENIDQLDAINRTIEKAMGRGNAEKAGEMDEQFHTMIIERSGNPEIPKLLRSLLPIVKRIDLALFGDSQLHKTSVADHSDIINALREGDRKRAVHAMKKNWLPNLAELRALRQGRQLTARAPKPTAKRLTTRGGSRRSALGDFRKSS